MSAGKIAVIINATMMPTVSITTDHITVNVKMVFMVMVISTVFLTNYVKLKNVPKMRNAPRLKDLLSALVKKVFSVKLITFAILYVLLVTG